MFDTKMIMLKLKWGIYSTTVAGFLTLLLLPDYSLIAVGFFLFVLIPSWFITRNTEPFPGYTRAWNLASALFILFTLILIFFRVKPMHVIFAYQIGFLQISKAFNPKKSRDILLMWILAFLMIIITAVLTRSSLFPFFLFFFILSSLYALIWLNVQFEAEKVLEIQTRSALLSSQIQDSTPVDTLRELETSLKEKGLPSSWRRIMTLSGFLVVFLSLLIFLLIPRVSSHYYYSDIPLPSTTEQVLFSGFSTEINLGCLRNIQNNPQPVMEVKINDTSITEENLYLRGGAFDLFTGTSWIKSQQLRQYETYTIDPQNRTVNFTPGIPDMTPRLQHTGKQSPKTIKQEISYIDFPSRHIFSLAHLIMLKSESGLSETVFKDHGDAIFILPPKMITQYEAYCLSTPFREEDESSILSNPWFTYIPRNLDGDKIDLLAARIAGKSSSTFEKARRIESFLMNDYQYSLKVGSLRDDNPIEDFLFSTKQGHCELFATSMMMLLRTQGIPCRLASGFHGGSYDKKEQKFIIRQSDAHTWVEVYDREYGWERFDPTPPAPMTIYTDRLYFKKISDFFTSLSRKWENFTFGYNDRQQAQLIQRSYEYMKKKCGIVMNPLIIRLRKSRAMQRLFLNLRHPLIISFAGFLFVLNLSAIVFYRRLKNRTRGKTYSPFFPPLRRMSNLFYYRMIKLIAGKTIHRPVNLTAREFLFELGRECHAPYDLLEEGSRLYYAIRFGPDKQITELSRQLQDFLNRLKDFKKYR
ncbi:transglutaminase domain-containing protein [Candidatus Sumerlaeota bacterium]|nr:transglutaminase domain-containing protein [Candidatus Sumerlaeota bacterium]